MVGSSPAIEPERPKARRAARPMRKEGTARYGPRRPAPRVASRKARGQSDAQGKDSAFRSEETGDIGFFGKVVLARVAVIHGRREQHAFMMIRSGISAAQHLLKCS